MSADRRLFRIKLNRRGTSVQIGYWQLIWTEAGYRLSIWRNTKADLDIVRGPTPEEGVLKLVESIEANLEGFVSSYRRAIAELEVLEERGATVQKGFRGNRVQKLRTQYTNAYRALVPNYVKEATVHLDTLPAHGWPVPSRPPFEKFLADPVFKATL